MLESTYIHCPGVGATTERRIWEQGARTWDDFLARSEALRLAAKHRDLLPAMVAESKRRLMEGDHEWFAERLPPREHWRAYPAFKNRIAYLDIETNGGYGPGDLTVIGMYDGSRLHQFVRGDNLDEFPDAIADKALIVTFFGSGFDIPFLRRAYEMEFPQLHIDLCFMLKRLGYSGGLKRIEEQFGVRRVGETHGLTGFDAVRLWREYRAGLDQALATLLAYNREDVLNMETLLDAAYPMMLAQTLCEEPQELMSV